MQTIPFEAEIIVADDDSTDKTVSIAQSFGARIVRQDHETIAEFGGNFDIARNQAMQFASRDWLLILDSDEHLTPDLAEEIGTIILADEYYAAYDMPRRNLFWGKPGRLLGDDRQVRLLRKGKGCYRGCSLHCQIHVDGQVGQLHEPLIHYNISAWSDVCRRYRRYLPIERMNSRQAAGGRMSALIIAARMSRYYLIKQQAWRDGWRGIVTTFIFSLYHGLAQWPSTK